jgi:biotin carboxyl carrier protein
MTVQVLRRGPATGKWYVTQAQGHPLDHSQQTQVTLYKPVPKRPEPYPTSNNTSNVSPYNPKNGGFPVGKVNVNGYVNPLQHIQNLRPERIDQGVDYAGSGPIVSPCNGVVWYAVTGGAGWPGQTVSDNTGAWVGIKFLDGPYAGKQCYFAENLTLLVKSGDTVKAGQPIAVLHDSGANLECGWAAGIGTEALARQLGQTVGGSAAGWSWNRFLVSLGAPSGISNSKGNLLTGSPMPAGYP